MRTHEELVIKNHRSAILRKRVIQSQSDKYFAKATKKSRIEFRNDLDDLIRKTEKMERNTLLSMKSQVLESSDETFKCDVAFCHNRLEGDKSSKTTWKFCSETCENSFLDYVRHHKWDSPTQTASEVPSSGNWGRKYNDPVPDTSMSIDNTSS